MKVILKEDVQGVGVIGDMVDVASGFARNYLLPRKLAVIANPRNIGEVEHHKRSIAKKREKILASATDVANKIKNVKIEILTSVGAKGKLYGSVTSLNIAEELLKKGLEIDRKKIELAEPIKRIGEYVIPIKLEAGVKAELKVSVQPDAPMPEEEEEKKEEQPKVEAEAKKEGEEKPKRGRRPKKEAENTEES